MDSLREVLRSAIGKIKLVIVDGVYSMEGDVAPLPDIVSLCREYGAYLMVDEAHSFPILGKTGGGVQEYFNLPPDAIDIKMGTLSKALSACGGYIAGKQPLIDYLRHQARGFVFSGGLSAMQVSVAERSLELVHTDPTILARLKENAQLWKDQLESAGFRVPNTVSPIVPILLDSEEQVWNMCLQCRDHGLLVSPVIFPAVPKTSQE